MSTAPTVQAAATEDLPAGDDVAPDLTARQYVRASLWALFIAVAMWGLSAPHVDTALLPVLLVTGAGAGFVASTDLDTRHIRNTHIATAATLTAAALVTAELLGQGVALRAAIAAAAVFVWMFLHAVVSDGMGGGDVKYAPVVAAGIAAVGPFAAWLWLWFVMAIASAIALALSARNALEDRPKERVRQPLGPAMAAACIITPPSYAWLQALLPAGVL